MHTHTAVGPHFVPLVFIIVGKAVKGSTPTVKQYLTPCPWLSCPALVGCFPLCCLSWILFLFFLPSSVNHNLTFRCFLHLHSFSVTLSDPSRASFSPSVPFVDAVAVNTRCHDRLERGIVIIRWPDRTAGECLYVSSEDVHVFASHHLRRAAVGRQRSVSPRRKEDG